MPAKKRSAGKTSAKKTPAKRRWVATVNTDSTSSAGRIVHQERRDYCQVAGLEKGFAQGAGLGHAYAELLHQPRRT